MFAEAGAGDAPYDSDRSLLRVIHDNLLSGNGPTVARPPPIPIQTKPLQMTKAVQRSADPSPPSRSREKGPPSIRPNTQAWDSNKSYSVGDTVSYMGKTYVCTIAHQAQVDWTPTAAVSLWKG